MSRLVMTIAVLLGAGAEFYLAIDTLIVILCMLESGLSMTLKKEGVTNVFTHFMEGDLFNTVLEGPTWRCCWPSLLTPCLPTP